MILAIDIGNTNLTLGLFKNDKLLKRQTQAILNNQYLNFLKRYFANYNIEKVIISSVVPQATEKLKQALEKLKNKNTLILGKNLIVPIKNKYQFPKQAGQDRLVNAFAAVELYGCPAIVVDFGTAITFDAVSGKKEYLGGMILPGLQTSLNSLARETALLPKIKISKPPRDIIGKNTRNSMLSGVIYGFSSLTDGVINKLKHKLGKKTKIIGTGGNIELISKYCKVFSATDINLTLKGLNLIARKN